jgi:knotted carbamoyltransferase YgeW
MTTIDKSTLRRLYGRSLLVTSDWTTDEIDTLAAVAERLEALDRKRQLPPLFPNELAYAIFFDNSTRTKSAWAGAAARLGMQPVIVDGSSTQVAHGETPEETGCMLGMNAHALGVRHDKILGEGNQFITEIKRGIDDYLAATDDARKVPIVNLQCDIDHPTQSMADLVFLRERFPAGLRGKKIAVSWAYSPSYAKPLSVPQGLAMLLTRYGAEVVLAHPPGYELTDSTLESARVHARASGGSFRITDSMDEAFDGAHVVYPKSWGPRELMLERVEANRHGDNKAMADIERRSLDQNRRHREWICDETRMAKTADHNAVYMHCLPADIGDEVTEGVMAKARVSLACEANKKLYVIMALLAVAKAEDLADRLPAL